MRILKIIGGVAVFLVAFYIALSVRHIDVPPTPEERVIVKTVTSQDSGCSILLSSPAGDFEIADNDAESCEAFKPGQDVTAAFS